MSFSDILDQPVAVKLMQNAIRRDRVPNGMLLWGPSGVGKQTAALEMAKAVNCETGGDSACDQCHQCLKIMHGAHPDVRIIRPSGKTRIFKMEVVDGINEMTAYQPFEGRYRVLILDDVERMNFQAQNHFLKTLEEPASKTLFILVSSAPNQLLSTIRSRCQKLRFGALSTENVASLIMKHRDVDAGSARQLAALSQGQMSRALNLVDTDKRNMVLGIMSKLNQGVDPLQVSIDFMDELKKKQEQLREEARGQQNDQPEDPDAGSDSKKAQEEALDAYVQQIIRQDLMEYLYLFKTLCRDEMVYTVTRDAEQVFNRDIIESFQRADMADFESKLNAIEKSWRYVERNLYMGRVFRDLFFILAA